jgi:hypothetical protein
VRLSKIKEVKEMKTPLLDISDNIASERHGPHGGRDSLAFYFKQWREKLPFLSVMAALPAILAASGQDAFADEGKVTPPATVLKTTKELRGRANSCNKPELLRRSADYRLPAQKGRPDLVPQLIGADNCPGTEIPRGNYTAATPYIDSGETTGGNSTVSFLCGTYYYCYYGTYVGGADVVYSFRMQSAGPTAEIRVTPTSMGFDPIVYALLPDNGGCPNGVNTTVYNWTPFANSGGPNDAEVLSLANVPRDVPVYLFVDSATSDHSGAYTLRMQDVVTRRLADPPKTDSDFDADGRADPAVYRPSEGVWYSDRSEEGFAATRFGIATDEIAPADYDGDGRDDIAVFRNGSWWLLRSSYIVAELIDFGEAGDIPVPADFSGDGRADLAVYRNGAWLYLELLSGTTGRIDFGLHGDKPVVADYDGDGRADAAVYRDGTWWVNRSRDGVNTVDFGLPADVPVPADYDGDRLADRAVYRNGRWYVLGSRVGWFEMDWGLASDIPVPADYDGDGSADAAIFRDGEWWIQNTTAGATVRHFGLAGDKPVQAAYLR